ncbi:hypothetical protein L596_029058 [Steinernema carpocapsae]|uniref:Uncharacterized protein n=1 Tax=Steinernema carpocapsae TaxID=34508 RepID=A0A4U5LTI8_STECR|nr:hypothetical protein L596_029058 [Steinernema carpocapsae]
MDAVKKEGDASTAAPPPLNPEKNEEQDNLIAAVEDALFCEVALAKWNMMSTLVRKADRHDVFSVQVPKWMAHMKQRRDHDLKRAKGTYAVEDV